MAECHVIGQLVGASDFPGKSLFCKYNIHFGESWKLISGLKESQTQIDSPELCGKTYWCHPIDLHFVTKSIQGWPKIHLEVYHQDNFGRSELCGYGFVYLPTTPGNHNLTCATWRPTGSLRDDIRKFFLGGGFQLKKSDIIFTGTDRYRLQTETMGKVYFDLGIILRNFHKYGVEWDYETDAVQRHCKNELCLHENLKSLEKPDDKPPSAEISEEFTFANSIKDLNEKDFYMVENSDQAFDSVLNKNNLVHKLQKNSANITIETSEGPLYPSTYYTEISEGINNGTFSALEVTGITSEGVSNTIVTSPSTETTIMKLSAHTTQKPKSVSHFILKYNFKTGKSICFCDIKVNECDINCCCDEDCSALHFKVFTKCIDDNFSEDMKYCYKNFIFGNNAPYEVVQKNNGLFCIAKENLKINFKYETKETLTSLEAFNKTLPNKQYTFYYRTKTKFEITQKSYAADSVVWSIQHGELIPFRIPYSAFGILCNAQVNIKYLVDQVITCFIQVSGNECEGKKIKDLLQNLRSTKVISNPSQINVTQKLNYMKICETKTCIPINLYLCWSTVAASQCHIISENSSEFSNKGCGNVLSKIQYQILHNGSEGIVKLEAHLWVKKLQKISDKFLFPFTTEVEYRWLGSTEKAFKRSGNPGYLTGKPILAGQKIYKVNETSDKKEALEVSFNPNDWLSVFSSEKGRCSFENRIPIYFREDGQFMCSLKLTRDNFTKEGCVELQNNIFKLLLGQDVINNRKENYFNKFVATFGNSRVEETGDWVRVLIDLFPLSASQTSFKSDHYFITCKNIITDLYINIVFSKIGSILAPQAKILGVSFQFGEHKDLTYHCDRPECENTSLIQDFKLSTSVNFIDITKPATDAFAQPLYLEVKFPHDFFYPFFSKASGSHFLNKFVFILVMSAFLHILKSTELRWFY